MKLFNASDEHFIKTMNKCFTTDKLGVDIMRTVLADYASMVEVGQAVTVGNLAKANQCLMRMDPDVEGFIPKAIVDYIHENKPIKIKVAKNQNKP